MKGKLLLPRIADIVTAIVIAVLGFGMVRACSYLLRAEMQTKNGVPVGISTTIVIIIATIGIICAYAAYRFLRSGLRPS